MHKLFNILYDKALIVKYAFIQLTVCMLFPVLVSGQSLDTIHWNEHRKLQFEDFNARIPLSKKYWGGLTFCMLDYGFHYTANGIVPKVYAVFVKTESSITFGDSTLLLHEQGHFDICEINARLARKAFMQIKVSSTGNDSFDTIIEHWNSNMSQMNKAYDEETIHGSFLKKQKEWSKKIKKMLNELNGYAED